MDKLFKNKIALVTGGSYGIGSVTALAFAERGASVIIADNHEDEQRKTLNAIDEIGGGGMFIKCDVSNAADVHHLIQTIENKFGGLDFAFNNAGIEGHQAVTHECTEENWDKTMDINLKGIWLCMKEEITVMLKKNRGDIVNTASIAGLNGFAGLPAYVASKHGIVGLTKSAALEYAKMGIRVNVVCPGVIHTEMIDRLTGKDKTVEKEYENMEPVGRMGRPEEVAEAVIWLCSDMASFVTGAVLPIDGGYNAK